MERQHLFITGRVQGVGYRAFAASVARVLGVVGWVRNLPDGSVEAVCEGPPEVLLRLRAELKRGPALADVESIDCVTAAATGEFSDFTVRRD